ncbi:MAG: prephenate dehydrogenase/arogenate dehydrogenase family protein, partial [Thiohalophilus sp.]
MSKPLINKLTIIGVGLIGGSLARALRRAEQVGTIVGCGRNTGHLEIARKLGVVDMIETDPAKACEGSDVIVLATPLGAMRSVLEQIAQVISEKTVITDVGSAKASVVADAMAVFGKLPANLVPGHPIAG